MDNSTTNRELPEKEARQGRKGVPVLVVLVAGLIFAAVAWWGAEIYGAFIETDQTIESEQAEPTD